MVDIGAAAPDFMLRDQHGQEQSLAARRGTRNVLLVFYPFAFTGVCTGEMHALSEHAADWESRGTDVLAVSCDFGASLRAFADREGLQIPLLSDFWPHGAVASSYGVFNDRIGAADRGSFVIDRSGTIRWLVRNEIPDARNIDDYLTALDGLATA